MSALYRILQVSLKACEYIQPLVLQLYSSQSNTSSLKKDNSILTLADGIVQSLFLDVLFKDKFAHKIGEEFDSFVNLDRLPYSVNDIIISSEFNSLIETTKGHIESLSSLISASDCADYILFLDPIDGTREFSSGCGEQSTICVGISEASSGVSKAGLIYRPIPSPPTYAMGIPSEAFHQNNLEVIEPAVDGFLTTNGAISPYLESLCSELQLPRIKAGGAGNKFLHLLEGRASCYIQDRGVSRWDTCGGQAVLEAHNGIFHQLSPIVTRNEFVAYSYLPTTSNLDLPSLSEKDVSSVEKASIPPYSNLCGLFALRRSEVNRLDAMYRTAVQRAAMTASPKYL